ncbi:MAG: hypothetical protein LC746_10125 [Acidobacteria bacterium]|nr:hypothetical protein [Acidobacteriota bacterium]
MSSQRRVFGKYLVWLTMFLLFIGISFLLGKPLERFHDSGIALFLFKAILIGSLLALSLSYFSARLDNEAASRKIAGCFFIAAIFFFKWFEVHVIWVNDPVISAMLIFLAISVAMNIALYIFNRSQFPKSH